MRPPHQRTPDRAVVPRRGLYLTVCEPQFTKYPLHPASHDANCTQATTPRGSIGGYGRKRLWEKHLPVPVPVPRLHLHLARRCVHRTRTFSCPSDHRNRRWGRRSMGIRPAVCTQRSSALPPRPHGAVFEKTSPSTRTIPSTRSTSPSTDTG